MLESAVPAIIFLKSSDYAQSIDKIYFYLSFKVVSALFGLSTYTGFNAILIVEKVLLCYRDLSFHLWLWIVLQLDLQGLSGNANLSMATSYLNFFNYFGDSRVISASFLVDFARILDLDNKFLFTFELSELLLSYNLLSLLLSLPTNFFGSKLYSSSYGWNLSLSLDLKNLYLFLGDLIFLFDELFLGLSASSFNPKVSYNFIFYSFNVIISFLSLLPYSYYLWFY